jgi:hypothetical protein
MFNFELILFDNETVSLPILELNIEAVSEVFSFNANPADRSVVDAFKSILVLKVAVSDLFNLVFILFDKETVSLPILELNIPEVSDVFNFKLADKLLELFIESILFDKETVSVPILSETYCVLANVPDTGKVTLLAAVVVIVKSPTPLVMILFAIVIVLPLLLTPVPPLLLDNIPVIVEAESEKIELFDVKE